MVLTENVIYQSMIWDDGSCPLQRFTGFNERLDKSRCILGSFVGSRNQVGLRPAFAGTRVVRFSGDAAKRTFELLEHALPAIRRTNSPSVIQELLNCGVRQRGWGRGVPAASGVAYVPANLTFELTGDAEASNPSLGDCAAGVNRPSKNHEPSQLRGDRRLLNVEHAVQR